MPAKIGEDKQNLIRKRYLQGQSIAQIAEELQIDRKTVKRYIKLAPAPLNTSASTGDDIYIIDYTTVLTKKEEILTKKIEKERALYEDDVEGWTYHLTKNNERIRQQGRWWSFIVYPDSAPSGWLDRLKATGMQFAISPLHDKDTWDHDSPAMVNAETGEIIPVGARYRMGDRKKAHWHVIAKCDQKTSWREMNNLLQNITNCPYIQKCRSLKNAYDYFIHANDPEKYQGYDRDEIIKGNNFMVEPTTQEKSILLDDVIQTIIVNDFDRMKDVLTFYQGQPEYENIIAAKAGMIGQLLKDNWREHNPDGKVSRVQLVDNELKDFLKTMKGKV